MITSTDPRHGTNAGYIAGCRETCCKTAHADYRRNLYARQYVARGPMTIPALGTQRRIRALQAIGWRISDIADALGLANSRGVCQPLWQLLTRDVVRRTTAERVAALYDQWCMTPGPAAARNAAMARRRGWAPPLAWDDIDDPMEIPHTTESQKNYKRNDVDPIVVDRVLAGDFHLHTTVAEKNEIMRRWKATGRSERSLCEATGWKDARYGRGKEVADAC